MKRQPDEFTLLDVIKAVTISRAAKKQLRSMPAHIVTALRNWIAKVEAFGLDEVKKTQAITTNHSAASVPGNGQSG